MSAEEKLTLAVKTNGDNAEAKAMYADMLWKQGRRDEALKFMSEAAAHRDALPEWQIKLAWMYFENRQLLLAQKYLERGLRQNSTISDAWILQGKVYEEQNLPDKAIAAYHQALFHAPSDVRAQTFLADLYLRGENPQRALETLQCALAKYPPHQEPAEILYRQGLAYRALLRSNDAVRVFAIAAEKNPQNPTYLSALAEAQYSAGMFDAALVASEAGLALDSQNAVCLKIRDNVVSRGSTPVPLAPSSSPEFSPIMTSAPVAPQYGSRTHFESP